jgi:hypothetical protein
MMPLRITRAVLCRRVLTDQETNSVTLVDCVEELAPKRLPASLPSVVLTTLWFRDGPAEPVDTTVARVRVVAPDGTAIVAQELPPLDFGEGQRRLRFNVDLRGVQVDAPGRHVVVVDVRDAEHESWSEAAAAEFEVAEPQAEVEAV